MTELVFRGLTRYDKDNKVVPALAESWQVAPDGRTYTFRARVPATGCASTGATCRKWWSAWGTPYDPHTAVYGVFASSQAMDKGGSNYGSYSNPAADKALEEGRSSTDPAGREAAYTAFQQALQDDPPFVWISYLQTINAVPENLTGPARRTLGHHGYGHRPPENPGRAEASKPGERDRFSPRRLEPAR